MIFFPKQSIVSVVEIFLAILKKSLAFCGKFFFWRSQKEIVEMVNLLFQQPNSFLLDNLKASSVLKQNEGGISGRKPHFNSF